MENSKGVTEGPGARVLRYLTPALCFAGVLVGAPVHGPLLRSLMQSRYGVQRGGPAR